MKNNLQNKSLLIQLSILIILIILAIIFSLIIYSQKQTEVPIQNFLGVWEWNNEDRSSVFSINFIQGNSPNVLKGDYCAIGQKGTKVDCAMAQDDPFTALHSGNILKISFVDNYSGKSGEAEAIYNSDDTLTWKITNKPEGEYYIPDTVVLKKGAKVVEVPESNKNIFIKPKAGETLYKDQRNTITWHPMNKKGTAKLVFVGNFPGKNGLHGGEESFPIAEVNIESGIYYWNIPKDYSQNWGEIVLIDGGTNELIGRTGIINVTYYIENK